MEPIYYTPSMKWQYLYHITIDGHSYSFGDREPMVTKEDAQLALTHAVETHNHIPVNILGSLEGEMVTDRRFVGQVWFADDLPDGSDFDPETERYVEVTITCSQVRHNTEMGE